MGGVAYHGYSINCHYFADKVRATSKGGRKADTER